MLRAAKNSVKGQRLVKSRAGIQTHTRVHVLTLDATVSPGAQLPPSPSPIQADPSPPCSSLQDPRTLAGYQSAPACQVTQCVWIRSLSVHLHIIHPGAEPRQSDYPPSHSLPSFTHGLLERQS